ncbi:MAG: hypothetical protein R3B48_07900 [Kofleriaceae bacterium]
MLEWVASLAVTERSERRLELAITSATTWTGWGLAAAAALSAAFAWSVSHALAMAMLAFFAVGTALATTKRRLVFDRDDGVLRVEQRIFGVRSRLAVPLFHLRAVVVTAEGRHFVAYLERRSGGRIRIDDGRHLAPLLALARAICDVTELRLVTDEGFRS